MLLHSLLPEILQYVFARSNLTSVAGLQAVWCCVAAAHEASKMHVPFYAIPSMSRTSCVILRLDIGLCLRNCVQQMVLKIVWCLH